MLANRFTRFMFVAFLTVIALLIVGIVAAPDRVTAGDRSFGAPGQVSSLDRNIQHPLYFKELGSLRSSIYAVAMSSVEQVRGSSLGPGYALEIQAAMERSHGTFEQVRGSNLGP